VTVNKLLIAPLAVLACAVLAGCNGTIGALEPALSVASNDGDDTEDAGRQHIGKPYKVAGRWYHPKVDKDYDETGMASWYGARFHGRSTANGEKFDRTALTAAHPTLPLPSFVRVTVVETGKSAVLRVNDRGPFRHNRILDVSRAAADELGFRRAGHAKVRVEYLGPAPEGGGDTETLVAAKKYGIKSTTKPKPSKARKSQDVEVRLAKAEPLTGEEEMPPGVSSRYAPRRSIARSKNEPSPASLAYAAEAKSNSALEAVIAMNDAVDEPKAIIKAQPLPETAANVSDDRFAGAHDLFASAGGSGISQAIAENSVEPEAETEAQ